MSRNGDVKARLYSFNISIAMLAVDTVELGLQRQTGGFFLIEATSPARESRPDNTCKVQHAEQQSFVDHFGT